MEQNIWIEARHTNLHGEPGKDLGSNKYKLDKNNVKSKKNFIMSEIKVNDFIIHLRMEKKLKEICGISIVEQLVHAPLQMHQKDA